MKSRKSCCTTPGVGVGIGGGGGVSKMFKFLRLSFLCDGQGAVSKAASYPVPVTGLFINFWFFGQT